MLWPEWWHWAALALALLIAELALPAFFIIWFGIAAAGVSLVLWAFPELALAAQILIWAAFSAALVAIWFRFLKPRTISAVGSSAAMVVGEVGLLVSDITPETRGQVRFQKPILGADLWECYSDAAARAGDRVRIAAVEGSFIRVEKVR